MAFSTPTAWVKSNILGIRAVGSHPFSLPSLIADSTIAGVTALVP